MKLRPYQNDAIDRTTASFAAGHRGVLMVVPTGGGKTVIYSEITRSLVAAGAPVLIVEPAVELVEQSRDKLVRLGVPRVGIVAAGWGYGYNPDPGALVQVATVQTLRSRADALLRRPRLIVFDEAHLSAADSYRMVRERYPDARRLGVTATPWRLDEAGFEDLASALVLGPTVRDLQGLGGLVPFRTRSIPLTAFAKPSRRPGAEFNLRAMAEAYAKQGLVGDVLRHYLDGPKAGKSGIVFGASTGHARELCNAACAAGIRAEYLDGATPPDVRRAILGTPERPGRLGTGETTLVFNFGVLTAGFDCPRIEYVGVARATASRSLWVQMAGRGLRPCDETGKEWCLVDDFGGNALRHGNLARRTVTCATCSSDPQPCAACVRAILDGRQRAEQDEDQGALGIECPACRTVADVGTATCAECGQDLTVAGLPRRGRSGAEHVDGQLVEIADDAPPLELTPPESADEKRERIARQAGRYLRDKARDKARNFGERYAARVST